MSLRNSCLPGVPRRIDRFGAVLLSLLVVVLAGAGAAADEDSDTETSATDQQVAARRTAVALNYCRSAFFRIRQHPTQEVLAQEKTMILSNLDLTAIHDKEIIDLYTAALDEISNIRISHQERVVVKRTFGNSWKSLTTVAAFGFLADMSQLNYTSMVRRGTSSWWDFRGIQVHRDMKLWGVKKKRLQTIQAKSSDFLKASWQLIRSHDISDRWLVRNADFALLNQARREEDPEVRLRMLQRLTPYMECYPPYWYYLGKTRQKLRQFQKAENAYLQAAEIGDGHFRRDELLATAMVNVASIRDYLKTPGAADAAQTALNYATYAPQVNLTAAAVLMRHGRLAMAENAVLRNLDVGIETKQSEVALLAVYARRGDPEKILARLDDRALVARTPIPILLRCAAHLKGRTLPKPVAARFAHSLHAYVAGEHLVVVADPAWRLRSAKFAVDGESGTAPRMKLAADRVTVHVPRRGESTPTATPAKLVSFTLKYDDDFQVKIALAPRQRSRPSRRDSFGWGDVLPFVEQDRPRFSPPPSQRQGLSIAAIETAGARIAMRGPVTELSAEEGPPEKDAALAEITPSGELAKHELRLYPASYKTEADRSSGE